MAKLMTKAEYDKWRSSHTGQAQFEIFHKDGKKTIRDFVFWAKSKAEAFEELEMFRQKQQLIAPSAEIEYFYREINNHIVIQDDGKYLVGTSFSDLCGLNRENTVWDRICGWFRFICRKTDEVKNALYDIAFWFGHYDMRNRHGEELADYWNISGMTLRKLKFNIPRLIENLRGCPTCYVSGAIVKTRSKNGQTLTLEQASKMQSTNEELEIAVADWKNDLEKLLLYIRLYEYYSGYGVIDDSDPGMKAIEKEYSDSLPVMPGTDGEIDYVKCYELEEKYWNLYCDHWKKIGRMCWD